MRRFLLFTFFCLSIGIAKAQPEEGSVFKEVTREAGISYDGVSYGLVWGDINEDGFQDIFCTGHGIPQLYINKGDGTFQKIDIDFYKVPDTSGAPLNAKHFDMHGGTYGDVNNDGFPDLYIPIGGDAGSSEGKQNILFLSNGDSLILQNRADDFGLADSLGRGRLGLWFDQNSDGYSDIFVCNLDRNDGLYKSALYMYHPPTGKYVYETNVGLGSNTSLYAAKLIRDPNLNRNNLLTINQLNPLIEVFNTTQIPFQKTLSNNLFGLRDVAVGDFNGDARQDIFMASQWYSSEAVLKNDTTLQAFLYTKGFASGYFDENRVSFKAEGKIKVEATIYPYKADIKTYWWIGRQGNKPLTTVFELDPNDPSTHGFLNCFLCVGPHIGYNTNTGKWEIFVNDPIDRARSAFKIMAASPITEVQTINFDNNTISQPDRMLVTNSAGNYTVRPNFLTNDVNSTAAVSVVTADFDNDMDLDLILSCQGAAINYENRYYENDGNGFFRKLEGFGAAGSKEGRSGTISAADYDNDGFIDLFLENGEGVLDDDASPLAFNDGPYQLFRNKGNNNHWIVFDIIDKEHFGNKLAHGTAVYVYAGGKKQVRLKGSEIHAFGQNDSRLHFGLGANLKADSVQIFWPDGQISAAYCLKADSIYVIRKRTELPEKYAFKPAFNQIPVVCKGDKPFDLPLTSDNGWKGTWQPATVNTITSANYVFTPEHLCAEIVSLDIQVNELPVISIQGDNQICAGDSTFLTVSGNGNIQWSTGATSTSIWVNPASDASYQVLLTDSLGCQVSDSFQLGVTQTAIQWIESNAPVKLGGTIVLKALGYPGAKYFWSGPNGFSDTLPEIIINNAGFPDAGVYSVYAVVNGCTGQSDSVEVVIRDTVLASGKITNEKGEGLLFANIKVIGQDELVSETDDFGNFSISLMEGGQYFFRPQITEDLLNALGISITDVVRIQRHLKGVSLLDTPYKIIAADVDATEEIDDTDNSVLVDIILGNTNTLPFQQRWNYITADYTFADPQKPFPYPDSKIVDATSVISDLDFIAMRTGDVDNSYFNSVPAAYSDTLLIGTKGRTVNKDEIFTLPFTVKDFRNISGIQFSLKWNQDFIELLNWETNVQWPLQLGLSHLRDGVISFVWYDSLGISQSIADSIVLFSLTFKAIGQLESSDIITLHDQITPAEVVDNNLNKVWLAFYPVNMLISAATSVNENISIDMNNVQLIPNPFREQTLLSFELSAPGNCIITVTDIVGHQLFKQSFPAVSGKNQIAIGEDLPAGTYLLSIYSGSGLRTLKMVVLR
jgi:hypothetical protein